MRNRDRWTAKNRSRHIHGLDRFPCPICGAKFPTRQTLAEHKRREHGGSAPVEATAR